MGHRLRRRPTLNQHWFNASWLLGSTSEVWARILVQVTIYRRLLIGRDGHLGQLEAYDIL